MDGNGAPPASIRSIELAGARALTGVGGPLGRGGLRIGPIGPALTAGLMAAVALTACGRPTSTRAAPPASSLPTIRFPPATGIASTPSTADTSTGVSVDLSGSPTRAAPTVGVPTEIDIPALGTHAVIETLGRNADGSLQVPDHFDAVGWYTETSRPGDPGAAVLAGHVDSYQGPAVFYRLRNLKPGDVVVVRSGASSRRFRVESVVVYPKADFPAEVVFGPAPDTALRLITCGGSFDRSKGSYRDNVVAFATEVQ